VKSEPPKTQLKSPFGVRPLMGLWNALYLDATPLAADPQRSAQWNRGNYLVNGLGHCGACHTPRNALGAEQGGKAYLSGTIVEGWEAPPLTSLSHAPVPWSEDELFRYLRFGHTREHGVAAGPMAPVVRELATLPAEDVRAIAHYLASFNGVADEAAVQRVLARGRAAQIAPNAAQRMFESACGACHHDGNGPMTLGPNLPLALNSNLHSARPDNLLRVILDGIREPATREIGFMPGYRDALDDRQIADLAAYMRARFAPDKPMWRDLEAAVARVRASSH
jgi:nicotinate dehydrogenase subunit B